MELASQAQFRASPLISKTVVASSAQGAAVGKSEGASVGALVSTTCVGTAVVAAMDGAAVEDTAVGELVGEGVDQVVEMETFARDGAAVVVVSGAKVGTRGDGEAVGTLTRAPKSGSAGCCALVVASPSLSPCPLFRSDTTIKITQRTKRAPATEIATLRHRRVGEHRRGLGCS